MNEHNACFVDLIWVEMFIFWWQLFLLSSDRLECHRECSETAEYDLAKQPHQSKLSCTYWLVHQVTLANCISRVNKRCRTVLSLRVTSFSVSPLLFFFSLLRTWWCWRKTKTPTCWRSITDARRSARERHCRWIMPVFLCRRSFSKFCRWLSRRTLQQHKSTETRPECVNTYLSPPWTPIKQCCAAEGLKLPSSAL